MQSTTPQLSRDSPAPTRVRAIDHPEGRDRTVPVQVTPNDTPTTPKRDTVSVLLLVATIVTPLSGVASLALILRFLRHVYDRGGVSDLVQAARALRNERGRRPTKVTSPRS